MCDISVILATYNRADSLDATLRALADLRTDSLSWELLVVDNNSSDRTGEVLDAHAGRLPLRKLFERRQGKNCAMNFALDHAAGELLVFTDDDVTADPDWLVALLGASRRPGFAAYGGAIHDVFEVEPPPWLRRAIDGVIRFGQLDLGDADRPFPAGDGPAGANLAVPARVLREANLRFDETLGPKGSRRVSGSEAELLQRLARAGGKFLYVAGARVLHRVPPTQLTTKYLLRRADWYGRGFAHWHGLPDGPRCLGVPRFLLRQWAGQIISAGWNRLLGRRDAAFRARLRSAHSRGVIAEYFAKRGQTAPAHTAEGL
jgi:glycosyltransferase involved in cell wall biosynthesis